MDGQKFPGLHEKVWPWRFLSGLNIQNYPGGFVQMPRSIFLAYMYGRPISYLLNWTPPILGVDNTLYVLAFVVDVEPHLFKFWDN